MKTVILGLPLSGQQQLFSLLSGIALDHLGQRPLDVHPGICAVRDPRIDALTKLYNPKKTVYAKIEYLLLPDFVLEGPAKSIILGELRNADEIAWVSRADKAETEINNFLAELILSDLVLIEKRLEAIAKEKVKKVAELAAKEKTLMEICQKQLEQEKPLSRLELTAEQGKELRTYQFLTLKPLILIINVPEEKAADQSLSRQVQEKYGAPCLQVCAEIEEEISRLPEADQKDFLKELGLSESALVRMNRSAFEGLGYISFFTVGEDEVRAWPIRKDATALEAGHTIHSDIAKGFVRAELMKYDDLIAAGSEEKVKEQGKFSLKGRDYLVADGDILHFRFNV